MRIILLVLLAVFASSCATHPPITNARQAMRPTSAPDIADDLDLAPLAAAIDREVAALEKNAEHGAAMTSRGEAAARSDTMTFGPRVIAKSQYLAGLRRFAELVRTTPDRAKLFEKISDEFDFYEVYGDKEWGRVFMTSYYESVVPGSRKRTPRFSRPLYGPPSDLIALDLKAFDPEKFALERKLRGRLVGNKLVPYFSREEIDAKGALKGRGLELVWVEPVDAHGIHVQGSGAVKLADGQIMRVGYADRNGFPYDSIGKYVRDAIPKDQLSLQAVEDYIKALPPARMQDVLDKDQSYIFFKPTPAPQTVMGLSAVDGRTIATDPRYFPKGALGFLVSTKPKWDASAPNKYVPGGFEPFSRFVLDQDIGGAITGGGRLDLYWGSGDEAKRNAGVIKQEGRLYYLVPKTAGT